MPFSWPDVLVSISSLFASAYYYELYDTYKTSNAYNDWATIGLIPYIVASIFVIVLVVWIKSKLMSKRATPSYV